MKYINKPILVILPLLYLVLGFYFNQLIGIFSLRNVDPEYIYLTNGLYMSLGHLNVYHIDNPGTPLQLIVALVCRVVYFFRATSVPYIEDVFQNSDLYLNVINNVVIILTSITIYISGKYILKFTSFLPYAFLVQTAPFYSHLTYGIIGRLTPELLLCIPVLLLKLILVRLIHKKVKAPDKKDILLLGLTTGFGLSIKLTFLPVLLLPFFIIPGLKDKLRFAGITMLSLFVFAFPILFDLSDFFSWIGDLFIHSGQYGGGDSNFININEFVQNFEKILSINGFLVLIWILSLAISILYLVLKKKNINRMLFWGSLGIFATLLVQFFIVSKHYQYRYLTPGLALFPAMAICSLEMLKEIIPWKRNKILITALIIGGFFIMIPTHTDWIGIVSRGISKEIENKNRTKTFVDNLDKNAVKLITPKPYGCPYHDFSMMISHSWAGWANEVFLPVYKKLYPDTYYYFRSEKRNKYWYYPYDLSKIIQHERPVYFYIGDYSEDLYKLSLEKMLPGYETENIQNSLLFINEATNERIYQLKFDADSMLMNNKNRQTNF